MLAAVPVALPGASKTRQMGVGRLRSFFALRPAATVMASVPFSFPMPFNPVMARCTGARLNTAQGDVVVPGATVEPVAPRAVPIRAFVREVPGG